MKLVFESDLPIPFISTTLSVLTDGAKVCLNDIIYDATQGTVRIQLRQKELLGFKRTFLGHIKPVYSQTRLRSSITVKQVDAVDIKVNDQLRVNADPYFTLLFGIKIDSDRLYLVSAEEIQGKNLCEISVRVRSISIEYEDMGA